MIKKGYAAQSFHNTFSSETKCTDPVRKDLSRGNQEKGGVHIPGSSRHDIFYQMLSGMIKYIAD